MGMMDNILRRFGYSKPMRRSFLAAKQSNLTADWNTTQVTADNEIRFDLLPLRARSRDLANNDPYAKHYLKLRRMNLVGPDGFTLQMKTGDIQADGTKKMDAYANRLIKEKFLDWAKRDNCSVSGQLSFLDICNLISDHSGRDGEFLIRKVRDKSFKYGFKLEILEPDLLNERLNQRATNGNLIRMGVEIDEYRRPIAYYITKIRPELEVYLSSTYSTDWEKIPASDIYHGFDKERAFQTRGVPVMASAMLRMKMLMGYEEAALVRARAAACVGGYYTSAAGETYSPNETDTDNNMIESITPNQWTQLPPGVTPVVVDPTYPDAQHGAFTEVILRGVASGLNIAYESLSSDYTKTNYSSSRSSLMNEREHWKALQGWMIESFLEPVFSDWLESAYMAGQLVNVNGNSLPIIAKWDKFNQPTWVGRRWGWVDPKNDIEAKILSIQAGIETATDAIGEQGGDIEEVYSTLAHEKELAKKYNLTLGVDNVTIGKVSNGLTPDAPQLGTKPATKSLAEVLIESGIPTNGKHQ